MIIESFMTFINKIMMFSAYVNNVSCFPKPLTLEEEKECFEDFWKGDKKAKEKLISHNLRLVAHIVKKYNTAGEADDLISVGSIGLIKAINTFQYGKKYSIFNLCCKVYRKRNSYAYKSKQKTHICCVARGVFGQR